MLLTPMPVQLLSPGILELVSAPLQTVAEGFHQFVADMKRGATSMVIPEDVNPPELRNS